MMLRHKLCCTAGFALLPLLSLATVPPCSIHPPKGASAEALAKLALIKEADARQIALTAVKADKDAVVKSSELEAEGGCLVWSYDIKLAGKRGVEEVMVDAGNGQVLSQSHESPAKEQAEQKADETPHK